MVARVAHFWRKDPFEVWALPFTVYISLRDDYLDIALPPKSDEDIGDVSSLERLDELADKGVVDIDYDAILRQQRRKKVRRG